MPVQSTDPVSAALQQTFSTTHRLKGSSESSLHVKIIAPVHQILREEIKYETSNCTNSYLSGLRSKYIGLKPSEDEEEPTKCNVGALAAAGPSHVSSPSHTSQSTKQAPRDDKETDLPKPKFMIYPLEKVTVGWKSQLPVGSGFSNMGNTCYLNATLQALFHVPAFVNWLLNDRDHAAKCTQMNGMTHSECLVCAMCKTLKHSHEMTGTSIKPVDIYSKLKAICRHLMHGHQEDAHEFLRYLIEGMERSYLSLFNGIKFDTRSKETTPLSQIFGGYLRNEVTCLECHHVSTTFQHFQDLILDIRSAGTVEDALEGFFSRERLGETGTGDQAYKCEQCKRRVAATKKFTLERPPKALCIQLKRFGVMGGKNNRHVTFKRFLDLTKYRHRPQIRSQIKYRLVAIVTHLGHSANCGHYTSVGQASNGSYYLFDDSLVRELTINSVMNTNAYILLYEMEEKKDEPKTNRPTKLVQNVGDNSTTLHTNGVNSHKTLDRNSPTERTNKPLTKALSEKSLPQKVANAPLSRASSSPSIVPSSTTPMSKTSTAYHSSSSSSSTSTPSSSPARPSAVSSLPALVTVSAPTPSAMSNTPSGTNPSRALALVPYSTGDSSSDSDSEDVRTDATSVQKNSGTVSVNGDCRKPGSQKDNKSDKEPTSPSVSNGHNVESAVKNHRSSLTASSSSSSDKHPQFNNGGTWEVTSSLERKFKPSSSNNSTGVRSAQSAGGKWSVTSTEQEKESPSGPSTSRNQSSDYRRDYQSPSSNYKTVETLEKMNHRGYGYPVNSWAGTKSEIEREIENETAMNKRPLYNESDEDDDSSRSAGKKMKFNNHRNLKDRLPMKNRFYNRKNDWSRPPHRGRPGNNMSSRDTFYYQVTMERGKSYWGRQS